MIPVRRLATVVTAIGMAAAAFVPTLLILLLGH